MTTKGERIKALREASGLTQEELAIKLHTTKQTISKYEKNIVTNIPSDRISGLCDILKTTPEYILGWNKSTVESEKNSKASGGIAIRLLKDPQFFKVVSMLYSLDENQLADVETLLKVSFKNSFNENK